MLRVNKALSNFARMGIVTAERFSPLALTFAMVEEKPRGPINNLRSYKRKRGELLIILISLATSPLSDQRVGRDP